MQVPIIRSVGRQLVVLTLVTMLTVMGASCSRVPATSPSLTDTATSSADTETAEDPLAFDSRAGTMEKVSPSPEVLAVVEKALAAVTVVDVDAVDAYIAAIEEAGLLAEAEASLSTALAAAEAAGRSAPGLQLALAAVYGRKGLTDKAYAAVKAAETAAAAPGVRFSLAAIHGRKALLAPGAAYGAFSISVSCDQRGAAASLDGVGAVPVPAFFEALRPGRHELTVRLPGYEPWSSIIEGKDGEKLNVRAALVPAAVQVTVASEPAGALVSVDGARIGPSPWTVSLKPGTYTVSATAERYEPAVSQLVVPLGMDETGILIKLLPLPARALIRSDPPGDSVQLYLDGEFAGTAPLELLSLRPGPHTVRSTMGPEDYGPSPEVSFNAVSGETVVLVVKPSPLFCLLEFSGPYLDSAFLSINGLYAGMLPEGRQHKLAPGTYKVELQVPGFKPFLRTVVLTQLGVSTLVEVAWVKDEAAAAKSVWGTDKPSFTVPRLAITVDGKIDDWEGTVPACGDRAGDDKQPKEPGTDITQTFFAYDDKYLYARIDMVDGTPAKRPAGATIYAFRLVGDTQKDGSRVTFAFHVEFRDGAWSSQVLRASYHGSGSDTGWTRASEGFPYKFGDGVLEMRVQRSIIEKYFKVHEKPMVWAYYMINDKWNSTGDDTEYRNFSIAW